MKIILALIVFIAMALPAAAKCDPEYAPYYMRQENGPGALLADVFLLPFALAMTPASAVARPKSGRTRGGAELTHGPGCLSVQLIEHLVTNRPLRPEPRD